MKIAIQGHSTRGKEVIQILKSLGGKSREELTGRRISHYYFINCNGDIDLNLKINLLNRKLYTLEEFEKEFPFKIGDKVITNNDNIGVVEKLIPEDISAYCVKINNISCWCTPSALRLYKEMKEERNITLTLDKAKEWYQKGGELKEVALQAYSEEELTKVELPKTWEEFCKNYPVKAGESWIGANDFINTCNSNLGQRDIKNWIPSKKSAEAHLALIQLEQLRDCWRQGWKPNWLEGNVQKYVIQKWRDKISIETTYVTHSFLSFPTYEMAREFLECFRDLIEKAGDLI